MLDNRLKTEAIKAFRIIIPQIPFNTIYSYADNLFDLGEHSFNEPCLQKQVDFLKKTPLSAIDYTDSDGEVFFTMTNHLTGESIPISNRSPTRGELRGQKLRDLLTQRKETAPEELAFETITNAIQSLEFSDMVHMLRASFSTGEAAQSNFGASMSAEHFDLYSALLLWKIQEKRQNKILPDHLEPKAIRDDSELQEEIWRGIPMGDLYDATQALTLCLQEIQVKSEALSRRGHKKAAAAAGSLYVSLKQEMKHFIQGQSSFQDFNKNFKQLINGAQYGELQKHRGFFGKIWHAIQVALHAITFGASRITPTQSIRKIWDTRASMDDLKKSSENEIQKTPKV